MYKLMKQFDVLSASATKVGYVYLHISCLFFRLPSRSVVKMFDLNIVFSCFRHMCEITC